MKLMDENYLLTKLWFLTQSPGGEMPIFPATQQTLKASLFI